MDKSLPEIREMTETAGIRRVAPKGAAFDPFTSYNSLQFEESGSACPQSGWSPCHLGLESLRGEILDLFRVI